MAASTCPEEAELSQFVTRSMRALAAASVETHLADCDDCRNLVFALATSGHAAADTDAAIERIGRFEVVDLIGRGAMGAVYRARDPELDRTVAIKVRHTTSRLGVEQEDRMRREAQALARLADPNVVGVFETGLHDDKPFVVMELVDGDTLQAWMQTKHTPTATIAMLAQAGRGLAAAHAVGLVHRDFKPSNVLVSRAQIAKVGDFGLVRLGTDDAAGGDAPDDAALTLTMSGALLGTPAYMAPEQLVGGIATEASDQFSFCVTLYEALYGQRPFRGSTLGELRAAMTGTPAFPSTPRIPAHVRTALARGLATEPAQRFGSMRALLSVLERRPRRAWPFVAGALAIAAAGATTVWASTRAAEDPCSGAELKLVGAWDAPQKAAIKAKLLATGLPYAEDAWKGVERALDSYSTAWIGARRNACEATRVHHEQSEQVLSLRVSCLDARKRELAALSTTLAAADKKIASRSVQAAERLTAIAPCDDVRALSEKAPTSPMTAPRAGQLDNELVRGINLSNVGKLKDSIAVVADVLAAAKREGFAAIEAQASLELGRLRFMAGGDPDEAVQLVTAALLAAERARDDYMRARAYTVLMFLVGNTKAKLDEADKLYQHGQAVLARLVGADYIAAQMQANRGQLLTSQGKFAEAEQLLRKSVEILEASQGPEHIETGNAYGALADVTMRMGDHVKGRALAERAYAIHLHAYGAAHPEAAKSLFTVAMAYVDEGKLDIATAKIEQVIATLEAALGKDHVDLATAVDQLGIVRRRQDKFAEAEVLHRRALALREKGLGLEHPDTSISYDNLGLVLSLQGKFDEALGYHKKALAIVEAMYGADSVDAAASHAYLANTLRELDRTADALAEFRKAQAIVTKALGPEHIDMAFYSSGEGHVLLDMHQPREAIAPLERALKLRGTTTMDPVGTGEVQFALARALWDGGGDRVRARTLAEAALPAVKDHDKATVQTWLAAHH